MKPQTGLFWQVMSIAETPHARMQRSRQELAALLLNIEAASLSASANTVGVLRRVIIFCTALRAEA